jgi:Domain of unknown function (DUF4440)
MRIYSTLVAVALAAAAANAQTTKLERELFAARDTVWRAWFHNDTTLLRRFIPPAAATLEGRDRETRWNTRGDIITGARGFADSKRRFVDVLFENTQIAPSGNSALVQSSYAVVVETNGKRDTTRGRATELFVLQGGTWVNPYWQLEEAAVAAGRAIHLPDTLGANFAIGDSANKAGTLADYDALVGTWEFRFQVRDGEGRFLPPFTGHWTFDKKSGGGLIEDHWRPDDPSNAMNVSPYTYRVFDAERKVWHMFGTWPGSGQIQPGLTWSDGVSRFAIQRGEGGLSRIRYLQIDANSFLWRADRSVDGGKTWLRDAGTMDAKRIAK